jgi:hypothetical protein
VVRRIARRASCGWPGAQNRFELSLGQPGGQGGKLFHARLVTSAVHYQILHFDEAVVAQLIKKVIV